jgi:lysophospholipase L1-like esterase
MLLLLFCVLMAVVFIAPWVLVRQLPILPLLPTSRPSKRLVLEPADIPAPRHLRNGAVEPHFLSLHQQFLDRGGSGPVDLLFLGDSITQGWTTTGLEVWNNNFAADHPANFGIAGDRTQNLLWRIDNGELNHINPRVVVLLIGTNNTDYPWEDIARADTKIVEEIREKLPKSKLLLLAIFPREVSPKDPVREKIRKVNTVLSRLDDGTFIRYLNIGNIFLTSKDTVDMKRMPDFLHPNQSGYQMWADAMRPLLKEMQK